MDALEASDYKFDLFIATDVIIYIGEINSMFQSIVKSAAPKSYFVFSTEVYDGDGYTLQETARWSHNPQYIRTLAKQYGCSVSTQKRIPIRKEFEDWIMGDLFIISLP